MCSLVSSPSGRSRSPLLVGPFTSYLKRVHVSSPGNSGLIYIDPSTLRRTTVTTTNTANQESAVTMATTASQLARGFGILMRQIADLLTMLQDYHELAPNLPRVLEISFEESTKLQVGEWGKNRYDSPPDYLGFSRLKKFQL